MLVSLSDAFYNKENRSTKAAFVISFRKTEVDDIEFIDHVVSGKAFTPAIFKDNYRKAENFLAAEICGLDFDDNISTADLANHKHANLLWFIYVTPSSTDDNKKSRAIIRLDKPVTDAKEYENLVAGLLELFADLHPDSAAKDCARFFYGNDTDDYKLLGNVVSIEQLKTLLPETKPLAIPTKPTVRKAIDTDLLTNGGSAYGLAALERELKTLANTPKGSRNQQLFKSSAALAELVAGGELDETLAKKELKQMAQEIGLDESEIEPTINSGFNHGLEQPRIAPKHEPTRYELNDIGNKNRFVDKFGNDLMYVPEFGKWYIWNNVCWSEDEKNDVQKMAESISVDIFIEAKNLNGHDRTNHEKHALSTGNSQRLRNMIDLAKQPFSILSRQLDTDKMLFCVENAVIDLKTGKPVTPDHNQYITKQASVLYDENAECPRFLQYLTDAMNSDTEMVSFIQRLVGYTMTGYSNEKIMVLVTGPQNSGKTLLVQILGELFGIKRYAQSLGSESLMDFKRSGKDASPDMAKLRGARFVWCDESKADDVLNAGLVKKITGGSTITARYLYQDEITFDPQFTLWFATNFTPKMATDDAALWSRIIPIHFDNVIPEEKQDKHLKQYIVDNELSGVLNWAIAGCLAYQSEGLNPPENVKKFKQRLYEDQDSIGQFVDLLTTGDGKKLLRSECYAYYKKYCENNSIRPLGKSRFNQHLENNMKIPLVKTELGWFWNGVELSTQTRIDIDNGGE